MVRFIRGLGIGLWLEDVRGLSFRMAKREFSKVRGTLFGGPYNKDPTI